MSARIAKNKGEWINRAASVKFSYEGREFSGFEGDSISSALWASGEQVLGRSFKYHRPRGILSLANHDVNVMLTDGMDTNMRGDVVAVAEGMALKAVNTDGGVKKDKNRFIDSISPLLPVGFYYKAFHTPKRMFPFWENIIRKAAGLGVVNFNYPRKLKPKSHEYYDVLVIGAGASGLSAALEAGQSGLRVIIADENAQAGGSLGFDWAGGQEASTLREQLLSRLAQLPNVSLRLGAYAAGYYPDHLIPLVSQTGMVKVRARTVIMASGAFEQPPVFRNNDIPGVMLGSAAQRLMHRYSVLPFSNGVVFTANDYGYRVALDLLQAGVNVAALVDLRAQPAEQALTTQLSKRGVKLIPASCIYEVQANADKTGVKSVTIASYDSEKNEANLQGKTTLVCDGVAMCAGWVPTANLLYQAGTAMRYDYGVHQFVPQRLPAGIFAAGRVNGVYALADKLADGARAARQALKYMGHASQAEESSVPLSSIAQSHAYPIVPHPKGKNFVDFDEDIQVKDFINAAKEGFDNIELMKRFTTVGMGPSQGKHSNMNAIRILARVRGVPVEQIGTTTSRPFFHPTPIGHLAGRGFHPHRLTPLHDANQQLGAVFTDVGAWKRAAYYQVPGLSVAQTVLAEVEAVRKQAGIIDSSSFGKIEVHGNDAALFLERFFTGRYADQAVGESRYTMLLDETGVVVDDGLAHRLDEKLFYLSSGTSNAAAVYREMQRWQQIWQLDIGLVNVTGAYAAINIAGPLARQILSGLMQGLDQLQPGSACLSEIAGVPVRLLRVAFVSDLTYELHIPTPQASFVWERVMAAGQGLGLKPFGTDAQRLLRLEMGHAMPGIDTDGLTNPFEIGADHALALDKPDFIGKRSLQIIAKRPLKKALVAFALAPGYAGEVPLECNLVIRDGDIDGRVTSIAYSATVNRVIGFAYVAPQQQALGTVFQIRTDSGALVAATVVSAHFLANE